MKHIRLIGLTVIIVSLFLIGSSFIKLDSTNSSSSSKTNSINGTSSQAIALTYDNMKTELSKNKVVRDLPKDSKIILKFYNFNSGSREIEKIYTLTKGSVSEGGNSGDIVLSLHSKYLNGLTNSNFCSVIQKANKNGDLGFETELSKASLAWKFKSVLEHKSCFGL